MEPTIKRQNWSLAIITLLIGLALGAFIHSRITEGELSPQSASIPAVTETPSDTVQISSTAQKEAGIVVESAGFRNLHDTLSATGTVSDDPVGVAHIRPLARGLIEKAYVKLGDRVFLPSRLQERDFLSFTESH